MLSRIVVIGLTALVMQAVAAEERRFPLRPSEIARHLIAIGIDPMDVAEVNDLPPLPLRWKAGQSLPPTYTSALQTISARILPTGDSRPPLQVWKRGSPDLTLRSGPGDYWLQVDDNTSVTLTIKTAGWYRLSLRVTSTAANSAMTLTHKAPRRHAVSQGTKVIEESYWCQTGEKLHIAITGKHISMANDIQITGPNFHFLGWPAPLFRWQNKDKSLNKDTLQASIIQLLGKPSKSLSATAEAAYASSGIKAVLPALITHPEFCYRIGKEPLTNLDHAALSALNLHGAPVAPRFLSETARSQRLKGKLPSLSSALALQIKKQKSDSRFAHSLSYFVDEWLELHRAPEAMRAAGADPALIASAMAEARNFIIYAIVMEKSVKDLLDARFVLVDKRLSAHYHMLPIRAGQARPIAIAPSHPRGGICTQAALLAIGAAEDRNDRALGRGRYLWRVLFRNDPSVLLDLPGNDETEKLRSIGQALDGFDELGSWSAPQSKAKMTPAALRAHFIKHRISLSKTISWKMSCFLARETMPFKDPEPDNAKAKEKWRKERLAKPMHLHRMLSSAGRAVRQ